MLESSTSWGDVAQVPTQLTADKDCILLVLPAGVLLFEVLFAALDIY
jgi:hypothetical protein